jgi:hypothetical protein
MNDLAGKRLSSGINPVRVLPAFAECPVRKDGDACEEDTLRSSEGAQSGMLQRVSPKL